jgi:hypothetical protein
MSISGASEAGAGRGARGGCREQNVLNDVMPELVNIQDGRVVIRDLPGAAIDFTNLQRLMEQQNSAMTNSSSLSDTIKQTIISEILTDEVRGDAREILGPMFAIPDPVENRNAIIDSILDSMIQDLSVFRSIQITGSLCLKAFYKNNGFRIAIAVSFVGSVGYVGWISGLGSLCGLTLDGCQIVFSALAACHHLIADPNEFMAQFVPLLGSVIPSHVAAFVDALRIAIATPALFAGLVAQGNVTLLERLYRQPAVPAPDAGGGPPPAQAQEPGHLENLRDAINAEINSLRALGAQGDHLQALLAAGDSINRAIAAVPAAAPAPAAAAAAPANPAAPADPAAPAAAAAPANPAAPADPAAPAAAAAAPAAAAANVPLFNVMLEELRRVGRGISRYVQRYVLNLYNYLNRVRQIFPGVVGANGTDFLSYSCNVFLQNRIISLFGIISAQFTNAGISERQTLLSTLLEYILPSNLRWSVFHGDDYSASKELGILVFRLKPRIIHCLSVKLESEEDALRLLDSCILFASTLTEDNLAHFVSLMPHVILERILLTGPQGSLSESLSSTTANPSDSPLPERLSSVQRDILEAIRKYPNLFVLGKELEMFQEVYGTGFKGAVVKLLNAQPTVVLSDVAQTAKCCVMHNVVSSEIALFEQPAEPLHLSAAHQKFLPLENLFSGMCRRLFNYTTDVIEEIERSGEDVTDEQIRQQVYTALKSQLGYNDDDEGQQKAETFVRRALLGFKLGCLWNPIRCTFTPAIGFKDGKPLAIMIIDIEAADVEVNITTRLLQGTFKVPCSFLESGGIPVPQRVVGVASSVRDRAVSAAKTFGGGLNFVMRGVVSFGRNLLPCSAPAAPVEVRKNPEIAASAAQVETAAVRSVEEIGEAAKNLSKDLLEEEAPPRKRIKVQLSSASKAAESVLAPSFEVELTADQEERLSAFLDRSQPVISAAESLSMVGRVAPATAEQLTKQLRDFVDKEKEKQVAESLLVEEQEGQRSPSGVSEHQVAEKTTKEPHGRSRSRSRGRRHSRSRRRSRGRSRGRGRSRSRGRRPSSSSSSSSSRSRSRSRSSERGRDGGLGPDYDSDNIGGSRTRRRRRSSSTRSSTTRDRKATSRRNQSKKHKQNSRRRRSTRKSSRKN